ncbi:MAG: hypothetical protein KC478_10925, partial [Bacteriovoracaceae bacterium]|nr:hypothetical protein [Bacteriovoracaceae bacterium]
QKPKFLESLIAKFEYKESGDARTTFQILLEMYNQPNQDPTLSHKLKSDLYALKAEIDLKCLNSESEGRCDLKDFDGNLYIRLDSGKYKAAKKYRPYQLHER